MAQDRFKGSLIDEVRDISYSGVDITVHAMISSDWVANIQDQIKKNNKEISEIQEDSIDGIYLEEDMIQAEKRRNLTQKNVYVQLGEIQTLSYSVYRDKAPVKVLGQSNPIGFARGDVTIAGTMIFTVLKNRIMHELFSLEDTAFGNDLSKIRVDQLPPIDIFVVFHNEMGQMSRMGIFGVEFMNEGQVMSVQDLITENSVNYVARHISPIRHVNTLNPDPEDMQLSSSFYSGLTKEDLDKAKEELATLRRMML